MLHFLRISLQCDEFFGLGFGNTVPKTNYGKCLTILLSTFGIPLTVVLFTVAGDIINNMVDWFLGKVETKLLKRKEIKKRSVKRLITSIIITTTVWLLGAVYLKAQTDNIQFIDCIYYIFQILTTIGYGDIYFETSFTAYELGPVTIAATFAMGITASLVSSLVSLIQQANAKNALRRISFSNRKSWSLNKGKKKEPRQGKKEFSLDRRATGDNFIKTERIGNYGFGGN